MIWNLQVAAIVTAGALIAAVIAVQTVEHWGRVVGRGFCAKRRRRHG